MLAPKVRSPASDKVAVPKSTTPLLNVVLPVTEMEDTFALKVPVLSVKLPVTAMVELLALNRLRPFSRNAPRMVMLEVVEALNVPLDSVNAPPTVSVEDWTLKVPEDWEKAF